MLKVLFFVAFIQIARVSGSASQIVTSRPVTDQALEMLEYLRRCEMCRYSDNDTKFTALKDKRLVSCFVTGLDREWLPHEDDIQSIMHNEPCEKVGSERDYVILRKKAGTTIAEMCRDYYIFWVNVNSKPPPLVGVTTPRPKVCRYKGAPPHIEPNHFGVTPSKIKLEGGHAKINLTFDDKLKPSTPAVPQMTAGNNSESKIKPIVSNTEKQTPITTEPSSSVTSRAHSQSIRLATSIQITASSSGGERTKNSPRMLGNRVTHRNIFLPVTDKDGNLVPPLVNISHSNHLTSTTVMDLQSSTPQAPPLRQTTVEIQSSHSSTEKHSVPRIVPASSSDPVTHLKGEQASTPSYSELLGLPRPSRDPSMGSYYRNAIKGDGKPANTGYSKSPAPKDGTDDRENDTKTGAVKPTPYPIPVMGSLDTPAFPVEALLQRLMSYGSPFAQPQLSGTNHVSQPDDNSVQSKEIHQKQEPETTTATIAPPPPDMRAPSLPLFDIFNQNKINIAGNKPETTTATLAPPPPDMRVPSLPLFDTMNYNKNNMAVNKPETTTATIATPPPDMRAPSLPLFDTLNQDENNMAGGKPEVTPAMIAPPPPDMRGPAIPAGVWWLMNNKT